HYEYEKDKFDPAYTKIYAGASIGSVIALLLVCGYTPLEIFSEIYNMDHFFNLGNYNNIWDVFKLMGLMSINSFAEKIEYLVKKKMGMIPSLLELRKKTGKTLIMTASNVSAP